MSTRANIIIKDKYDKLYFYRHSDGYPEGAMPTLERFMSWVKEGHIRDNVNQAAGWLIVIGHQEYEGMCDPTGNWKVGAYEPAIAIHGDIEYLYVLDLEAKTITIHKGHFDKVDKMITEEIEAGRGM